MRTRGGYTVVEVLLAGVIGTMIMGTFVSISMAAAISWRRGATWVCTEQETSISMRQIDRKIRGAISVQVDPDNMGFSFKLPALDSSGTITQPVAWDGVTRRYYISNGSLLLNENGTDHLVAENILATDPVGPSGTDGKSLAYQSTLADVVAQGSGYKPFETGDGVTRLLTVTLVCGAQGRAGEVFVARKRERVYLRNVLDGDTTGGDYAGNWQVDWQYVPPPPPGPAPSGSSSSHKSAHSPSSPPPPAKSSPPKPPPPPRQPVGAF